MAPLEVHVAVFIIFIYNVAVQCNALSDPDNGAVNTTGTKVGDSATYSCDSGYELRGNTTVTCHLNGDWSESPPICEGIINCTNIGPKLKFMNQE